MCARETKQIRICLEDLGAGAVARLIEVLWIDEPAVTLSSDQWFSLRAEQGRGARILVSKQDHRGVPCSSTRVWLRSEARDYQQSDDHWIARQHACRAAQFKRSESGRQLLDRAAVGRWRKSRPSMGVSSSAEPRVSAVPLARWNVA